MVILRILFNIFRFSPVQQLFFWSFIFILPLAMMIKYANKYALAGDGKKIFYKLPLATLLWSIIGNFGAGFLVQLPPSNICSGEGCMGVMFLQVILVIVFVVASIILSFFVNSGRFNNSGGWQTISKIASWTRKTLIFIVIAFVLLSIVAIIGSIQVSTST